MGSYIQSIKGAAKLGIDTAVVLWKSKTLEYGKPKLVLSLRSSLFMTDSSKEKNGGHDDHVRTTSEKVRPTDRPMKTTDAQPAQREKRSTMVAAILCSGQYNRRARDPS